MVSVRVLTRSSDTAVALRDTVEWADELHLTYAWASSAGGTGAHWKALPLKRVKRAVIGIHFNQTEPYVLRKLRAHGVLRVVPDTGWVFHPKLLVALKGSQARVLVGSSNVTSGGFGGNTEVNILLTGARSDETMKKLVAFIDEQWVHPRAFEPDNAWLAEYEKSYASRPKPPKGPKPRTRLKNKSHRKKIKAAADLGIDWIEYVELIREQERRLFSSRWGLMHVFEHPDGSYLQEIEGCLAAFKAEESFKGMPLDDRKLIAGWGGESKGYLGWMGGAGRFKRLTAEHPGYVGRYLDAIPLAGAVSLPLARQYLNGIMSLDGVAIGSATRLLCVKRPDLFLSANQASQDKIRDVFDIRPDTTDKYLDVIEQLWSFAWFKAPMPDDATERRLWRARVALLDALFYEPGR